MNKIMLSTEDNPNSSKIGVTIVCPPLTQEKCRILVYVNLVHTYSEHLMTILSR
jgi:hypothetical protein